MCAPSSRVTTFAGIKDCTESSTQASNQTTGSNRAQQERTAAQIQGAQGAIKAFIRREQAEDIRVSVRQK